MILVICNYIDYKDNKKFVIFLSLISFFFLLVLTIFYTYVSLKVYFVNPDFMFTKWMMLFILLQMRFWALHMRG